MRIIPKKIKVKNTIFKCYSLVDIIVALVIFILVFIFLTTKNYFLAVLLGISAVILLMPTQDGILYTLILDYLKFFFKNKKYSSVYKDKKGIKEIIPIKSILDNGLVEYDNGYFSRVIKLGQKNFALEDEVTQDLDINYVANALKELDLNSTLDIVKIDRPLNLDNISKEYFTRVSSENNEIKKDILFDTIDRIDNLNNISKRYISSFYIVVYSKDQVMLDTMSLNISLELGKAGIESSLLNKKDTAIFLKYNFTKNFDEREYEEGNEINWIMPKNISFTSNEIKLDGETQSILGIVDYPVKVKNAWGADLFNIPNTKVVLRIKPVEKYTAIKRIDKCINEMETKSILSEKASDSNVAKTHMETMQVLLDGLQTENESLFDCSLLITSYKEGNENYKRNVKREINILNFKPSLLVGNQIEAFKSSTINPSWNLSKIKRGINSSSLAAIFPFVHTHVLENGGVYLGENINSNNPFILNIWKRGSNYQNSNGMVIGKSGSGKSFFLKNLILSEWANGTNVIILDPEAEYSTLTKNLSGNLIDVGKSKSERINPFHIYKVLTEEGSVADGYVTFNTHLKTLESFFKITLDGASNEIIELINSLVIKAYKEKGIKEGVDISKFKPKDFPTFSDVYSELIKMENKTKDEYILRDLSNAKLYLEKFTTGRYSDIWNGPSTLDMNSSIIDFNFQSLFLNKNNVVANAQMLLIFRFIEGQITSRREHNKFNEKIKTLIICDEAHMFIDAKYPIALDFFYSLSKRIRKYDGSFIAATQNIADWNANEELRSKTSAIIKNSQYMFIFKLSAPDMKDLIEIYGKGENFNEDEQRLIISSVTGQCFYIGSYDLRTSMKVTASNEFLKIIGESHES